MSVLLCLFYALIAASIILDVVVSAFLCLRADTNMSVSSGQYQVRIGLY